MKFKKGDKVKIKEGMDLVEIGILFAGLELKSKESIISGKRGTDGWDIDGWYVPERYIEKA